MCAQSFIIPSYYYFIVRCRFNTILLFLFKFGGVTGDNTPGIGEERCAGARKVTTPRRRIRFLEDFFFFSFE